MGGLYGVGHTRPTGQQPQQTLSGCTGQGAWQVVTEAVPGRGGRWHLARDGPEGWARVGVSGEAQGEPGRRGQRAWKPRR